MGKKKSKELMELRRKKINAFDPNGPSVEGANIFGLPFTPEESEIVLIPVPWESTVSYGGGTAKGPRHILEASAQVDLYHPEFPELWKVGIAMEAIPEGLFKTSKSLRKKAEKIIQGLSQGEKVKENAALSDLLAEVNKGSLNMIEDVYRRSGKWLDQGKLVGLVGGDHSTPLGYFKSLAEKFPDFGILQIDAHMDLRKAYEGFTYSHASIMYNAMGIKNISRLVQIGIRDFCQEELEFVNRNSNRIKVFTYADLQKKKFEGAQWKSLCEQIIAALPAQVYISFDIDGLDPKLCPNTGTPVPGGFEFNEITYLLSALAKSKKKIIGFDLNEVSPGGDDWDGNVGARMLFHLCGVLAKSNKRI